MRGTDERTDGWTDGLTAYMKRPHIGRAA